MDDPVTQKSEPPLEAEGNGGRGAEAPGNAPDRPDAGVAGQEITVREWWQERNRLGVRNWELTFILIAAVIAGIVVTIGTSLLGVR
jgi:hypothetical protein